jgi:hypothetical protein
MAVISAISAESPTENVKLLTVTSRSAVASYKVWLQIDYCANLIEATSIQPLDVATF